MIGNDWDNILIDMWNNPEFISFMDKINKEYEVNIIYPPKSDIFNALKYTSYKDTKVVIIGQDPYHGDGEAMGLSFSVHDGIKLPPSLRNIYKELKSDLGIEPPISGDLSKWAKEGVLLLNATLTVIKDNANSHSKIGWELFTDYVIQKLNEKDEPIVFILWGNFAKTKKKYITNPKHLIIETAHPSPLSARHGFFGSKPFSKVNEYLRENGIKEIDWRL